MLGQRLSDDSKFPQSFSTSKAVTTQVAHTHYALAGLRSRQLMAPLHPLFSIMLPYLLALSSSTTKDMGFYAAALWSAVNEIHSEIPEFGP